VHTDNSAAHRYRFACEQCHALRATGGAPNNTVHANGDDNTAGPSYAEVRFTDNAGTAWSYGTSPNLFETVNTKINPYLGAAVAPSYLDNATSGGTDPLNSPNLTWSTGTCGNVWCHSNANPASAGGGANTYRTPRWTGTAACNACHLNRDTFANMGAAADRMSMGHQYHLATDRYGITCDECHANTVANDCTAAILDPGGFPFHVNGVKTDIKGSTTLENTAINDNTLAYDGAGRTCSNTYCHSNGKRQAAPFAARLAPPAWNVAPAYSCATNPCHASTGGTAAASFAADTPVDNSAHLAHPYGCNACHVSTTADNATVASYALHVNGVKDVTINALFDSDANPANNYTLVSKTCAGIACHGGKPVAWTDSVTSCDACHTTTNGVAVTANAYDYTFSTSGAPNMSKVSPSLFTARGHGASAALPWTGGTNPSTLFGRAMVCTDCHNMSVPHGTAGNPFRFLATVNGKAVTFDNVDTLCFACHNAAAVQRHAKAVTGGGSSLWEHNQRCVDCHDVHGQSNIFMVYDSIVWQDNGATAYATSDGYGVPYNPTLRTTVSFTATTAGSNFAGSGAYNGICEVCHERTAQYQRNNALGKGGAVSHPTSVCTACHKHEAGFKGGGCKGCHGPDQTIAGAPDVGAYWATKGHGSPAVTTLMGRAIECEDCHDVGYLTSADHKTNVAGTPPTNINTYNYPGKTIGTDTQTNGNTSHLKAAFLNTSASTRADVARTFDNYCMNASCHKTLTQHRHVQPPGDVMRFGDNNTVANPKLYNWLAYSNFPSTYPTDFYRTLSPWIDSDIRVSGLADTTNYGLCITCHDPHGTPVTDNTHTGNATLGYTNHMLRGNWATDPAGFCNKACHTTRTPP
jgi:predicted CxxxxCH...CXXCH cytochrome family protein